jgi:L-2-hydroxyglutarate oxidase
MDKKYFKEFYRPGIRAQLVDKKTMTILNDFRIEYDRSNFHILNIVSPGWTCAMPVANFIVDKIFEVIESTGSSSNK